MQAVSQAALKRAVHAFFGGHGGNLRIRTHHERSSQGLLHEFVQGHHAADQPGALGLGGVHHAAGERHFHGLGFAHSAGQALRTPGTGNHAQLDLGLAEFGVVGGDDEVTQHSQLAAATQGETGDGGNHRLADAAHRLPVAGDVVALVHIGKAVGRHAADIGTRRKRFFAAGDDQATQRRVGVISLQRVAQLVHQLIVQGIELLGTVQRHDADFVGFGAGLDVFVMHGAIRCGR